MSKPQMDGFLGMTRVQAILAAYGRKVRRAGYYAAFDLLVDDNVRVEVKTCPGRQIKKEQIKKKKYLAWTFNIHRHGKISQGTDCYIFRLEGLPQTNDAMHILLVSPVTVTTIEISMRSLLEGKWAKAVEDFHTFKKTGILPKVSPNAESS